MQEKIRLQLQAKDSGGYLVRVITAGNGNGMEYSRAVLKESVPLWEGVKSFIDHSWTGQSVRDLCGVFKNAYFDEEVGGVAADFVPFGPAKDVAIALAEDVLENPELADGIGFSGDIFINATGKRVDKITRVLSGDVVVYPARGGEFVRALNQIQKENLMTEKTDQERDLLDEAKRANDAARVQLDKEREAKEQEKKDAALQGVLNNLLTTSLAVAKLPKVSSDAVRKQFVGRTFDPVDLQEAIDAKKEEVAALQAASSIQGPGRVQMGSNGGEQFEASVYDLLGAQRPDELAKVDAPRLSGIREMYTLATGDVNFHGAYNVDGLRVQLATTASLPKLLADVTNKIVHEQWMVMAEAGYEWWKPIVNIVQTNSMQDLKGIMVGQTDILPTVAEGAAYTELDVTDSKETAAFVKKGGYLGLTLEMFHKDDTRRLQSMPKILANAGIRTISSLISAVFTANAGAGPAMADGNNLFTAGRGNLLTTALSADNWDIASAAIFNQALLAPAGDDGGKLGIDAKYLLVPRALRKTAWGIMSPADLTQEKIGSKDDVIVVPEWTDANDWAAVADPRIAPGITLGHIYGLQPEIFVAGNPTDYAVFTNDQSRIKVRHISAVLVEDYRPLHKNNVA